MTGVTDDDDVDWANLIPVERLLYERGVVLVEHADGTLQGNCPIHEDDLACLVVDTKTNTWSCAWCNPKPAFSVDLMMYIEGISKEDAIELLLRGSSSYP